MAFSGYRNLCGCGYGLVKVLGKYFVERGWHRRLFNIEPSGDSKNPLNNLLQNWYTEIIDI